MPPLSHFRWVSFKNNNNNNDEKINASQWQAESQSWIRVDSGGVDWRSQALGLLMRYTQHTAKPC